MELRHLRYFCAVVDHVKADSSGLPMLRARKLGGIQRANGD
jgi:hypothetical protein